MSARSAGPQCGDQALTRRAVGRQTEAQQIRRLVEPAAPDVMTGKAIMDGSGIAMPRQPEQRRTADDGETGLNQRAIEGVGHDRQLLAHLRGPAVIGQCRGADREGGTGAAPGSERLGEDCRDRRRGNGEAQPQAGEAIELSERAQDHNRQLVAQRGGGEAGIDIDKGFVDDQPAAIALHVARCLPQHVMADDAAIRVVRVDDHDVARMRGSRGEIVHGDDLVPGAAPGRRMLVVGMADHGDCAAGREMRQPLDQRLRAGSGDDVDGRGHAIGGARCREQRSPVPARRQTPPDIAGERGRHRPGMRIDAGREIEPRRGVAAVSRHRLAEIAAMLHGRFMPPSRRLRERIRGGIAALAIATTTVTTATASGPHIASINMCTDQLLMILADPDQILGLSPYARDKARSWMAADAARFPLLSGEAEDVLELKPDLVVAGRYTKRATRELLKRQGLKVVEFDAVRSIDETKQQIRRMGETVGHPDRAAVQIARIDAAVARARAAVARKPLRVLSVSRRGWVSGGDTLTSSLLATIGVTNAAGDVHLKPSGGFASLETIVAARPDFIIVSEGDDFAEDQGRAFLLHPALRDLYPPDRRIVLPERLTVCGGPMLANALDRLVTEFERVSP